MEKLRLSLLLIVGIISVTDAYSFYSPQKLGRASKLVIMPAGPEQTVFQGESFFVQCSSEASSVQRVMWTAPEGQQITAYTGSVPPSEIPRIYVEDGRSGHKGVDLVFENITRKDRGTYTCSARVDGVEESVSFELSVYRNINFEDTPSVQFLEEGNESTLICNAGGEPAPKVSWLVKGRSVKSADGGKYRIDPKDTKTLYVQNVSLEDAGEYQCKALQLTETSSNFKYMKIDVKVHHKPHSMNVDDKTYSYITGTVNLTCEAVAEPKANFSWVKDGDILTPSETVQIINYPNKSILQLNVVDQEMFGDYVCVAANHLGTMERVIILEIGSKPPKPTVAVSRSDVNALHLSLKADNVPEMPILGYRIQYKKAGDDWNAAHAIEFKKGDAYIINGLTDDTLYVLRAYAKNAAGYSDYSEEALERTKKVQALNVTSSATSISSLSTFSCIILAFLVFL